MVLNLNTRKKYKEFYGKNKEQMPKLISKDRVPMNVAQLMQIRLSVKDSENKVKSAFMNNYFDTCDGIMYNPEGRIKLDLDSETLKNVNKDTILSLDGGLFLNEHVYNAFDGEEFKEREIKKLNGWLSKKEVKDHPIWKALARDQELLDEYVDYIFAECNKKFDYTTSMGIFIRPIKGHFSEIKPWRIKWLEEGSSAYDGNLKDVNGRFIGIAPEALSKSYNIKTYTKEDLNNFDISLKNLEGKLNPYVLESFTKLRKKL